jgi:iron complex transport system ATP-binding protein
VAVVLLDGHVPAASRPSAGQNPPAEPGRAIGRAAVRQPSVSPIFSVTSGVSVLPATVAPATVAPATVAPAAVAPAADQPADQKAAPARTYPDPDPDAVIDLAGVTVTRSRNDLLQEVDWQVREDERWVVLGPNGAGKTTLLSVAAARLHPTSGRVAILGEQLGKVDVFELRPRIGLSSAALAERIPSHETVTDVVVTAAYAVVGRFSERYDTLDTERGLALLAQFGVDGLAARTYGTLSEGERKRVQIARALMTDPEVLMLDEPAAGLDLGGREDLVRRLSTLASDPAAPALVLVTHHVEEIPPGVTHALLLREGRVVAAGPLAEALTGETLSRTFGLPLQLDQRDGRYSARAV